MAGEVGVGEVTVFGGAGSPGLGTQPVLRTHLDRAFTDLRPAANSPK